MPDPRERLEKTRHQTRRRLAVLTRDFEGVVAASRDSNADDEHDPEGATIAFERSLQAALVRDAQQRLADLDAAIERWDSGAHGVCEGCGQPISVARLEARPTARTCIGCASAS